MMIRPPILLGVGLLALVGLAPAATGRADEPRDSKAVDDGAFKDRIVPLLTKHCFDCHNSEKQSGSLNLTKYGDAAAVAHDRKTWERVAELVETGQMPPAKRPRPADEEVEQLVAWVETKLSTFDCKLDLDPGRVTMRRLNRVEYNNTIRDLVGVDFKPADDFPSDDVGYGFDNIGTVLTLSPILMEKYLAAAEQVAERAIVADHTLKGTLTAWKPGELPKEAGGNDWQEGARVLTSTGEITVAHEVPRTGEYVLRAEAFEHHAGGEPAKMEFRVDGKAVRQVDVAASEEEPETYEIRVPLEAGPRKIAVAFLNDYYKQDGDEKERGDRNLIVRAISIQGPVEPDPAPLPESHRRILFKQPEPGKERAAARAILDRFAGLAYRRPPRNEELDRLVALFDQTLRDGASFERGVQVAVEAVLVSPHFLFRVEPKFRRNGAQKGPPANQQELGDFQLASRLSYFLWSSMPDDELFRLAREKKLHEPDTLEAQARRMLRDPKSRALVENFVGQWLQLRNLKTVAPASILFPDFDDALRSAMQAETELFFEETLREDRSVMGLLDADYTYLNERLARHYGIPGVQGDHFRRVSLGDDRRGGILTMASVLTVTSNPTRTSPVKRGRWVLEQILGTPPPPPPPNVPDLKDDPQAILSGSLRERMERHRSDPNCATCHARMDPLGFGLENYDAVGAWRDKDGAFPIDAAGTLPSGKTFKTPKELKAILKDRKRDFERCLTEKLLTYALGRGLEAGDACAVEGIVEALPKDGDRFSRLVAEIVRSAPFRMRKTGDDQ